MALPSNNPAGSKALVPLLMATLFSIASTEAVHAHDPRPLVVDISVTPLPDSKTLHLAVAWKTPASLPYAQRPQITLEACEALSANVETATIQAYHAQKRYKCSSELEGVLGEIIYPQANPALPSFISISNTIKGTASQQFFLLPPGERLFDIAFSPSPTNAETTATNQQSSRAYLPLGISHILSGYDHLLFLICLMLLSPAVRPLLVLLTGFTLAHSLTLALHSLGTIRISSQLVEPLIALSIAVLAAELYRNQKTTLTHSYPFAVTFGFGLLHGLGFAGVLLELGLPAGHQLQALLMFNLGVEIGQIMFVAVLGGIYLAARRLGLVPNVVSTTGPPKTFSKALLLVIGSIASFWFLSRLPQLF